MEIKKYFIILLWSISAWGKEPELPLCPPNIQYFPQNLPMHCRMPNKSDFKSPPFPSGFSDLSGLPGGLLVPQPPPGQPSYPGAQPGLPNSLVGIPSFQGQLPGMPGIPSQLSGMPGIPSHFSGMPGIPGPLSGMPGLPGPMQMSQKLPVVVMPFYSQDTSLKKKVKHRNSKSGNHNRARYDSDESNLEDSTSLEGEGWRRNRSHGRRELHHIKRRKHRQRKPELTPLLQYVTKDGYVIYEKTISNGEAKSWVNNKNEVENIERANNRVGEHEITHDYDNNHAHGHENNQEQENNHEDKHKHKHESEEQSEMKKFKIGKTEKLKLAAKQRQDRKRSKP